MILRPYQARAIEELWQWFVRHKDGGNPIIDAAVGAGKSVIIAAMAQRAMTEYPGTRILVVVHQHELLTQNVDKIRRVWPQAPVGIWSAASGLRQIGDVTFATIGSIYKSAHQLGRVDLVFCDEAHLINPKEAGMWRKLIADLRQFGSPGLRVVGFTGTPFRGDGVWLTDADEPLFTGIATRVSMTELLELGYLAPLEPASATQLIDTRGVRTVAGDYNVAELEAVAGDQIVVQRACEEIVALGASRRRWLVFAVTVRHAMHVRAALKSLGAQAEMVTATTPKHERDLLIEAFRDGRLRCLVNVAVLTTGFDVPEVDFIALLRPTKSPVLYCQIMGRGMRILGANVSESAALGKANCLVADFTDTSRRLGPVDAIRGRRRSKKKGASVAPFRVCESCGSHNAAGAAECADCGFAFPPPAREMHGTQVAGVPLLSSQTMVASTIKTHEVDKCGYDIITKDGAPTRLCVSYYRGLRRVAKEWVFLEHQGFPRQKAQTWWYARTGHHETPKTCVEAKRAIEYLRARGALREPRLVSVDAASKWQDIVHVVLREANEEAGTAVQDRAVSP